MGEITYEHLAVGDHLPSLTTDPINRTTLALYAGASGDHNPIHIDSDFAKQAGMPDVFAQGMLSMAYLARLLTDWMPQSRLKRFSSRFMAITNLQDRITCSGTVTEKSEEDGEKTVRLELKAANQDGDIKLAGEAVIAFN